MTFSSSSSPWFSERRLVPGRPILDETPGSTLLFERGSQASAPLVTVAIPAYRRSDLLQQALLSIAAQEDFTDFEVLVCDDLGSAATRSIVEQSPLPRIRLFANPHRLGGVGNWNRCLQLAAGRWTTILHEDDVFYPWFFRLVVPHLRSEVAAVATRCVQNEQLQPVVRPATVGPVRRYSPAFFLKGSMSPFPGVVFPTVLGQTLGGFDERLGAAADYDFWYRLACAGPVEVVQQVGAFYRLHAEQWTGSAWPDMLRKAHLLRCRIAREQFPDQPAFGRWLARFFTYRTTLAYEKRFAERPAGLARAKRFQRIAGQAVPSGWVWRVLQQLAPRHSARSPELMLPRALHPASEAIPASEELPTVTVAICTYNRVAYLRQTLVGAVAQNYPADRLEILVIDNGCTAQMKSAVQEFAGSRFALRYVAEPKSGLNHARNRAVAESRHNILVLADDDILVQPDWIRRLVTPFVRDLAEQIGCVGGEVVPVFPEGKPDWVSEWHAPLAFRETPGPLTADQIPMGANLAIRRSVLVRTGSFTDGLDRVPGNLFAGGEREMIRRIRAAGWRIWFAPDAAVEHQMPASRTTFAYAARHAFDSARSRVFERILEGNARSYLLSRFVANIFKAIGFTLLALLQLLLFQIGSTRKSLVRAWRSCGYLYAVACFFRAKIASATRRPARSHPAPARTPAVP